MNYSEQATREEKDESKYDDGFTLVTDYFPPTNRKESEKKNTTKK